MWSRSSHHTILECNAPFPYDKLSWILSGEHTSMITWWRYQLIKTVQNRGAQTNIWNLVNWKFCKIIVLRHILHPFIIWAILVNLIETGILYVKCIFLHKLVIPKDHLPLHLLHYWQFCVQFSYHCNGYK